MDNRAFKEDIVDEILKSLSAADYDVRKVDHKSLLIKLHSQYGFDYFEIRVSGPKL